MSDRQGTIVYVHGASDRRGSGQRSGAAYHQTLIEQGTSAVDMRFDVLASMWGEAVGPSLDGISDALPSLARGVAAAEQTEDLRAFPRLDQLAAPGLADSSFDVAWGSREADLLLAIAQQMGDDSTEAGPAGVVEAGEDKVIAEAARAVAESPEYAQARISASEEALIQATMRAIVERAEDSTPQGIAAVDVFDLGDRMATMILGLATSARLLVRQTLPATLLRVATDYLVPRRAEVMSEQILGLADILVYMANGNAIRAHVRADLETARAKTGKLIALGNSLGGIILFDILREEVGAKPDLFVTVGSQPSALATFGALSRSPDPFAPWLNIYCHRDFVGFVAQAVWPSVSRIKDEHVDLGVGFPAAHGQTYLANSHVFRAIKENLGVL